MIIFEGTNNWLLTEGGIRNMKELSNRYKKAKIYFHQDLDGVTTALAMKKYLENNGVKVVDSEYIQYGDSEFSVKKPEASGDVMPVLVDFAHGKPMFTIHTDHHDSQAGVEDGTSTQFRGSRSNVETISQVVSPTDIFPSDDIKMISTIDSADYVNMDISVDDVLNYIFKRNNNKGGENFSVSEGKKMLALLTNKLLLAYKNKPNFLSRLVMESEPSLVSIFINILKISKESGYASPSDMSKNQADYIEKQSNSDTVKYDEEYGIITQYGGGSMFKPGSYDRYTPFKNNPEADFIVLVWPMGLIQSSCNPFKKNRSMKGVNLGDIAQETLLEYESELKSLDISMDSIKYFAEKNKKFDDNSVGFTYNDMVALFDGVKGLDKTPNGSPEGYTLDKWVSAVKKLMVKPYNKLSDREIKALKLVTIDGWSLVQSQSGGHKCITNVSGFMYFGKNGVPFIKRIARSFYVKLRDEIKKDRGN